MNKSKNLTIMKKFFKILLWVVIAAIFAGTFFYLFKNSQPKEIIYNLSLIPI